MTDLQERPATDPHGIYTLDQLPRSGLVLHQDFLSYPNTKRRLMPVSPATWKRQQNIGEAPPTERLFGRAAQHAEHIRAIITGQDWRTAQVNVAGAGA